MLLTPGARLGPYEVLAAAGAGGMGEVWKARDTRLDRSVAIKVLPAEFAKNAELRLRFEREAKSISQLNHPHICTLYDVGNQDGIEYLVLEYIEGETMADRLQKGALPLDQVIRYGTEIAEALDRAHKAGIVHRDLKPGNVMLTKSGAKLLDFGLAKPGGSIVSGGSNVTPEDATVAAMVGGRRTADGGPLTAEGTIIGTFQYMAPEQIEGKEADARTDIFAFGALLYEMATGKHAFEGKSKASLIASILATEPQPISASQPASPESLDRLIRTCLAKEPDERWQSAHDVAIELRSVGSAPTPARGRRNVLPWIVAAAFAIVFAGILVREATRRVPPPQVVTFEILPADKDIRFGTSIVSPDGKLLVISTRRQGAVGLPTAVGLSLRSIDGTAIRAIPGTEEGVFPFWSPDSRFIGFFARGKLKKVGTDGTLPQTICDTGTTNPRGGTWNGNGVILFAGGGVSGIERVSANGGKPLPATNLDPARHEINHRFPSFLPDGTHFLYLTRSVDAEQQGIFIGSLDGTPARRISSVTSNAVYAPPGFLLYAQAGALRAQRFDLKRLELTGTPVTLADGVTFFDAIGFVPVGVSNNGVLSYGSGALGNSEMLWLDRTGKRIASLGEGNSPAVSPDGKRVAYQRLDKAIASTDIWIFDRQRGTTIRMTDDPRWDQSPVWSRDGATIAWTRFPAVLRKKSSGAGAEERIGDVPTGTILTDWTPDGRYILGFTFDSATNEDVVILPVDPPAPIRKILSSPFAERWPKVSPDGKWLAFTSDETGTNQVYVQRFDPSGAPQQKLEVSRDGGFVPQWTRDGRSIVWIDQAGNFLSAEITSGAELQSGQPKRILEAQYRGAFDLAPDGEMVVAATPDNASSIQVIVNWPELMKRNSQ